MPRVSVLYRWRDRSTLNYWFTGDTVCWSSSGRSRNYKVTDYRSYGVSMFVRSWTPGRDRTNNIALVMLVNEIYNTCS